MNRRLVAFLAVAVLTGSGATAFALHDLDRYRESRTAEATVPGTDSAALGSGPRIVFRHTGIDRHHGQVAMVSLSDPSGPRAYLDLTCDRIAAAADHASCLSVQRGVLTRFEALDLDADWSTVRTTRLPGMPSRTRLSPDGTLVATTSFVTGHSYASTGFSTATEIREFGGRSHGNLEDFGLVLDGTARRPADRNIWGVTFADDDRTFYATVATGGDTWLVRGDLADRTLTSVAENAECPSLSPDGTRVAFKVDLADGGTPDWVAAVLDLETGELTRIDRTRGLDDQIAWLDDDTLVYGLPRPDEPGVTDVWAVDVAAGARPQVLIEQAWSPTVVDGP